MPEPSERFLRLNEVMEKTGLKRPTIYHQMNKGKFPKSISITTNCVAWLESEVNRWIEEKINQRAL